MSGSVARSPVRLARGVTSVGALRPALDYDAEGMPVRVRVDLLVPTADEPEGAVKDTAYFPLDAAPLLFSILGSELADKHGLRKVLVPEYTQPKGK